MIYVIKAYENEYGGMHGMVTYLAVESDNIKAVAEIASDESRDIINDYEDIWNSFEERADEEGLEAGSEEWDEFISICEEEDVAYNIYEVTTDAYSVEEINDILGTDPDGFIEDYCKDTFY